MRAPMVTLVVCLAGGCGPAVPLEPDADTDLAGSGDTDSSGTGAPDTITSTSSAPQDDTGEGEAEVDSGGGSSSDGGETGPAVWPPEGNGTWLCTGFEDPIFLTLEVPESGAAMGTVCMLDAPGEPETWTACGELFDHANIFQSSIYFAAMFEHSLYPDGQVSLEMGVDYVAETDTLVGIVAVNGTTAMETCERYVP